MRLNLGCGTDIREGWVNVDIRPFPGVDIVADIATLPFPNESVEEIMAFDVIEHFPMKDVVPVLAEWHRVLVKGGKLVLRFPHLLKIFRRSISGTLTPIETIELLYGNQDYGGEDHIANYHKSGMLLSHARSILTSLGFVDISTEDPEHQHNLVVTAVRG